MVVRSLNRNGNTIVASVVGLVIGGLAMTYTLKFVQLGAKGVRATAAANDLEDARRAVGIHLASVEACNTVFGGKSLSLSGANPTIEGIQINASNGKSILPDSATPNDPHYSMSLTDLKEVPPSKSGNTRYLAAIAVRSEQAGQLTRSRNVTIGIEGVKAGGRFTINGCFDVANANVGDRPTNLSCPSGESISAIDFETRTITCVAVSGGGGGVTSTPRPTSTGTPRPEPALCTMARKTDSLYTGSQTSIKLTLSTRNIKDLWINGTNYGPTGDSRKEQDITVPINVNSAGPRMQTEGTYTTLDDDQKPCLVAWASDRDRKGGDLPRCNLIGTVSGGKVTWTLTNTSHGSLPDSAKINNTSVTPPNDSSGPASSSIEETIGARQTKSATGHITMAWGDTYTCTATMTAP